MKDKHLNGIKKHPAWVLILLAFITFACIDEIDLNIDTDQRKLAVDGFIADSLDNYSISLSYSSVIGEGTDNIQHPVSGAKIKVLDELGTAYVFQETEEGIYTHLMEAEIGKEYYLDIQTPDGRHIQSKPQSIRSSPTIDTSKLQIETRDYLNSAGNFVSEQEAIVRIDTRIEEGEKRPYLRWQVEGEYEFRENYPMALNKRICYIPDRLGLNQLNVFNTADLAGNELFDQEVIRTALNYRFAAQYCFHIYQFSISEDEFTYWNNIRDMINREGSLFDPPPGTVRGNLVNVDDPGDLILGYFSVAGVSYRRFFVNEDEIGFYVEPRCSSSRFRPQYPDCRDCRTLINSTTVRPEYWEN